MRVLVDELLAHATFTTRPKLGPIDLPALVGAVGADLGADGRVSYVGADH
ncbi:MAG: hypothetical protein QOI16_3466 [Pseudonocardiales bacterium]|jgi:hypothetical protein|nr:hypothetical protein [Pseudonocardiales bacterium]